MSTLSWENIVYQVSTSKWSVKRNPGRLVREKNTRKILNNVSGSIETGEMVAIIGASGAGKTSLMAALCQRIRGKIHGRFYVNHMPAKKNTINSVTGFMPQYETAVGVLTALEHLRFVAELKLGRSMSKWEKEERVQSAIERLGMCNLSHTRIKHLSGGERKRLNLAEEMIREPLFLFCDEPTTGLDSYNARSVMQSLKELTQSPSNGDNRDCARAVICSIHQPSSAVFNYFSHIILMDNGSIVFRGKIQDSYALLDQIGLGVPPDYNPAEFFVKLVSPVEIGGVSHAERIEKLCSVNDRKLMDVVRASDKPKLSATDIERVEPLFWATQIFVLLKRAFVIGRRDLGETFMNSSSCIMIALGIGIVFSGEAKNSQAAIADAQGMFFNTIAQIYFYTYKSIVAVFTPELPVVRKETGENLYSISSYYIMKFLSLLPRVILECLAVSILVYFPSSFSRGFETFVETTITYIVLGVTAASWGFMWGSLFGDGLGGELSTPIDLFQMIVSGIYINLGTIPPYLKYFSLFYFFNETISYQFWSDVQSIECAADRTLPCLRNGTEVLQKYSFRYSEDTVLIDYLFCFLWCLVFHVIGYLGLKRVVKKEGFY